MELECHRDILRKEFEADSEDLQDVRLLKLQEQQVKKKERQGLVVSRERSVQLYSLSLFKY